MPPQIKAITSGTVDIGFMLRMFSYPVGITAFGLPLQRFCLVVHQDIRWPRKSGLLLRLWPSINSLLSWTLRSVFGETSPLFCRPA